MENNHLKLPFSLTLKDMLLIGLFVFGAGAILYQINKQSKESLVKSTVIAANNTTAQASTHPVVDNSTAPTAETRDAAPLNETPQKPAAKVENPLTGIKSTQTPSNPATSVAVTTKPTPATTSVAAKPTVVAKPTTAASTKPTTTSAKLAPPTTVAKTSPTTNRATPSNTAPAPTGTTTSTAKRTGNNYYLIAGSRSSLEEAIKAVDALRKEGYNPIIISPSKGSGSTNYRISVFSDKDRTKVENYTTQIDGKSKGFWIFEQAYK